MTMSIQIDNGKESKEQRKQRIQDSENGRKNRTRVIPNKKKDFDFNDYD